MTDELMPFEDPFESDTETKAEPFEDVCELPNSGHLYRQKNAVGGYTYWSDEVGGGVLVWDTCMVGEDTLLCAITEEMRRRHWEAVAKRQGVTVEQLKERVRRMSKPYPHHCSVYVNGANQFTVCLDGKEGCVLIFQRPDGVLEFYTNGSENWEWGMPDGTIAPDGSITLDRTTHHLDGVQNVSDLWDRLNGEEAEQQTNE